MNHRYSGLKVTWRLILLQALLTVAAGTALQTWLYYRTTLDYFFVMAISQALMLIPIAAGGACLKATHPYAPFSALVGMRTFDPVMLLLLIVLPLSSQYFASFMQLPYIEQLVWVFGEQADFDVPANGVQFAMLVLSLCVLAPVLEELLFRGIIMKLLDPYGTVISVLVSAFGFALLHFSPPALLVIFVVGLVLGIIRIYSGSVFACMIFHSFFNLYSIIALVFDAELTRYFSVELTIFMIVMAVLFPLFIYLLHRGWGRGKWFRGTVRQYKGGRISLAFTIVVFAAVSALTAVSNLAENYRFGYTAVPDSGQYQDGGDYYGGRDYNGGDYDDFFEEFFGDDFFDDYDDYYERGSGNGF